MVIVVIVLSLLLRMGFVRLREVLVVVVFGRDSVFAASITVIVSWDRILRFIMLVVIIRVIDILDRIGRLRRQSVTLTHWHLDWGLLRSVRSIFELIAMEGPTWGRRSTGMARIHVMTTVFFVF